MIGELEYVAPMTVDEALAALARYGDDGKVLAGGQSLLLLMRYGLMNARCLVDIKGLSSLDRVEIDSTRALTIGAITPHRAIETSPVIRKMFPVLAEMERELASVQTRNWGTIGGNLCHADPAGDPAPVLIALGAEVEIASASGTRTVEVESFFRGYFETVLRSGELLREIRVPFPARHSGTAFSKFCLITGDFPLASVAVSVTVDPADAVCRDVRVALGAAGPVPLRARRAEDALRGQRLSFAALADAARLASEEAEPPSDMHASAEYRRELIRVLVQRVARQAWTRATPEAVR